MPRHRSRPSWAQCSQDTPGTLRQRGHAWARAGTILVNRRKARIVTNRAFSAIQVSNHISVHPGPWPESQREVVDAMVRAIIANGILTVKFISSCEDTLGTMIQERT